MFPEYFSPKPCASRIFCKGFVDVENNTLELRYHISAKVDVDLDICIPGIQCSQDQNIIVTSVALFDTYDYSSRAAQAGYEYFRDTGGNKSRSYPNVEYARFAVESDGLFNNVHIGLSDRSDRFR